LLEIDSGTSAEVATALARVRTFIIPLFRMAVMAWKY
jgi:hypothetical protein